MSPLNPCDLNFDTCDRLTALEGLLHDLDARGAGTVLDVGGHPGYLARLLKPRRVITMDVAAVSRKPYVRGTGAALPFASESLDAVVASDTLEHVPPEARERFLSEVWRVARRHAIVAGPYDTPGVAAAEARFRDLISGIRAASDPWLDEHERHGLPDLAATRDHFERLGGRCAVVASGDLLVWFGMFCFSALADLVPGAPEVWSEFVRAFNTHFRRGAPCHAAYRHIVVAAKGDAPLPEVPPAPAPPSTALIEAQVDALGALFRGLRDALVSAAEQRETSSVDLAHMRQMERALQQQEALIQSLRERLREYEDSTLHRALQRLMGRE
jgi:SAM-dependent methyltransferase